MDNNSQLRPHIPGSFPSVSANSFREGYLEPGSGTAVSTGPDTIRQTRNAEVLSSSSTRHSSDDRTAVPSPAASHIDDDAEPVTDHVVKEKALESTVNGKVGPFGQYEPARTATSKETGSRTPEEEADHTEKYEPIRTTAGNLQEDEIFRVLSRRRTNTSGRNGSVATSAEGQNEEQAEIERLMSRMFGKNRQAQSEDEKTRHVGVVFKNLVVKGVGLGAALQPTLGDLFLTLPRLIGGLFSNPSRAAGKPPIRTLINNFNGCIRPGEMLLVLGRPGSGCSTFLKVLANQRYGYKSIEGKVTYGGTDAEEMHKGYTSEVVYNPEDDLHYATLSVKATLEFALKTRTPGKASRNEGESRQDYVKEFLRVVAKLFWIEHTMNTKVGNEFVRGVSGGEKKRVSIAEAMITKASTQCWDNSTRGLDASTALEYVQSLRSLTNMAQISTAVALYQAGESLYGLFDKVILIDEGRCLYYGPTEAAAEYFENLGFNRPARWTTADFLTSVTDSHERQIREGYEDRIPRSAEQFEEAFLKNELYQANLRDIEEFEQHNDEQRRQREAASTKATKKKNYTLSFQKQVAACTSRQFKIMYGDPLTIGGKWGGILFQALIVGSLFYNIPQTSSGVFETGGVMFFILLFNALLALAELTAVFASRPILLKHKSFSFYRPAAFAIAQTVVDVPLVFVQVIIFDIIVYFMADLGRTAGQFFISLLTIWVLTMSMYSFFRAIGAWVPSLDVATRITGVAIQALVVYTGYLIPPTKMHPWFKWLMYINPVAYAFEILMVNQFDPLTIQCEAPYLVPQGPNAAPQYQSCTIMGSVPGQTTVSGAAYVETSFQYSGSHLWRNVGILFAFWIFFLAMTMLGQELQKPNAGGGAVTIFKRGQAPKSVQKAMEKGSTPLDEEKAANGGNEKLEDGGSDSDKPEVKGIAKNEAVFTYQNVNYTIPTKEGERKLLQDVQGYVRPGKLTALMGASGAGKTTLLNTLAQRINFGVITGDFLVDGRPLPKSFQRATGFAEQQDVHEPTATVREALRFSALLRQPKEVPIEEKYDYCEKIIDLLEMRPIAGATIGQIGEGLNQEQRKRLTIGVELASKPELLLFLDEPTSGLDSGAAFNVVRFLRKLADAGQAILCTIHQPSSVLFEHFDELLLLKSGGRVVYHGALGKDSRQLIEYFEKNGAKKCPPDSNPAEYMLEAIGAGDPNYKGKDWGDVWASSAEHEERAKEIQQIVEERRNVSSKGKTDDNREYAMPYMTQVKTVVHRSFTSAWRTPQYMVGKFLLHIITGLFNSFTFYHVGNSSIDMQSRLFSIFMTLTIAPPLIQQLQPKFIEARQIYESREANSKIYSWFAFVTGAILVEIPYSLLAGTLYMMCWWWPAIGRGRSAFDSGYTWMLLMLFELFYVSFGQAIASFSPNELLASLLVPVFFIFVVSFCGIVVPYAALPYFWRSWMYYLTPFRYLLGGFLAVAVHDVPVICDSTEFARFAAPPGQTCQSYTAPYVASAGGYVQTGPNGLCEFCQYATGDQFVSYLPLTTTFSITKPTAGCWFQRVLFREMALFRCILGLHIL
jgi:ATP-binding cassette subfamily G (WHITE) protein 2 (SNQ2)